MVYNRLYDILPQVAENGDLETLAASRGMERDELRKLLASLDEGIPASLYSTLDRDSVVLSPVGQAYAAACAKASRLFRQAELKAESVKRERESCLIVAALSKGAGRAIRQATSCKVKTILFDSLGDDAPVRLKALGADFDLAIGLIDEAWLRRCRVKVHPLGEVRLAVALDSAHELASRRRLDIEDLYDQRLYVPRKGHSKAIDMLTGDLRAFHPHIMVEECPRRDSALFKALCEEGGLVLVAQEEDLSSYGLKTVAVDWGYKSPYGLIYSQKPSARVEEIMAAVEKVKAE